MAKIAAFAAVIVAIAGQTAPINDLPNPYTTIENHFRMPEGRSWGSTSAVGVDRDGTSIWVGERCGANSCLDSGLDPILKFSAAGALLKSFGAKTMVFPHGMFIDRDGNIWAGARPGVQILAPNGDRIGMIRLPENCANVCFGGTKRNRLFMAASQSLYSIYVNTTGAHIA